MAARGQPTKPSIPTSTIKETSQPEGWQDGVWRAYCKGNRNVSDLKRVAEAYGGSPTWHTVKRCIERRKRLMAEIVDTEGERVAYEAGLESDLQDADAIYNRAVTDGNANGQIGALRLKIEARERLAASRGVVTKREGREHSGAGGAPLSVVLRPFEAGEGAAVEE